jgi:hypothetical protein
MNASPDGPMPTIRHRRRLRRAVWVLSIRGGWPAAHHHATYPKEQRYVASSAQAPPILSLGPPQRAVRIPPDLA